MRQTPTPASTPTPRLSSCRAHRGVCGGREAEARFQIPSRAMASVTATRPQGIFTTIRRSMRKSIRENPQPDAGPLAAPEMEEAPAPPPGAERSEPAEEEAEAPVAPASPGGP